MVTVDSEQIDVVSLSLGWEDSNSLDCSGSNTIPEIQFSQRRMELWHFGVGDHGIWREALLGLE